MKYFLALSELEPVFWGSTRCVYVHPDDPNLLIKVPRREAVERLEQIPHWRRRFQPIGASSTNLYEMRECMRLRPAATGQLPHLYTPLGLIQTTNGWGQIVEAERDAEGNYAPTLASIARESNRYQKPLAKFLGWLKTTPAIFYDLNPWNLVLAWRNGQDEIVVIDGIGENRARQSRAYFPFINRRKNEKEMKHFCRHMKKIKSGETIA